MVLLLLLLIGSAVGNLTVYDDNKCVSCPESTGGQCPCRSDQILVYSNGGDCSCRCISHGHDLPNCYRCPDELDYCAKNCCVLDVTCDDDGTCRSADSIDFVTAAKIAVLFALVVTCLAVLVALFRAFLLPRWCQSGRTRRLDPDSRSVNSVQRFVLERLRTRPPPYEHQPEKPPSYDECIAEEGQPEAAPPAYGVAVISMMQNPYSERTQAFITSSTTRSLSDDPGVAQAMPTTDMVLDAQTLMLVPPAENIDDFEVVDLNCDKRNSSATAQDDGVENRGFELEVISSQVNSNNNPT